MLKRGAVMVLMLLLVAVAEPAWAKSWKSNKKLDPGAGRASVRAMRRSVGQGVVSRARNNDRDRKNAFLSRGVVRGSNTSVSGEWSTDIVLDNKKASKRRSLSVGVSSDGKTVNVDYDAGRVDVLFPVLYGVCGPKVGAGANVGGEVRTVNKKNVAAYYVSAGADGQIGCGVVVKCPVAWIGGGLYLEGKAGTKICPSGSCVYAFVEGGLGPGFEAKLACLTVFSWRETWSKEYYLGAEYF